LLDPVTCNCQAGYVWDVDTYDCNGTRTCSNDTNATGVLSPTECSCKANFTWNPATYRCELNCSIVLYSTGGPATYGYCPCITNFFFDPYMPQCVIDCTLFNNSVNANVNNITDRCRCRTKYSWNITLLGCQLSCATVANSNGTNDTMFSCFCNPGYYWVDRTA
jgi:hypothetical protein